MSTDPERLIEKWLKACARKRGEEAGAPLALHPATRRMLQGEVARHHRKASVPESLFSRWFAQYGRRLAFATSLLAVLVVGFLLLVPKSVQEKGRLELAAKPKDTLRSPPAQMDKTELAKAAPAARREVPVARAMPSKAGKAAEDLPTAPPVSVAPTPAPSVASAPERLLRGGGERALKEAPAAAVPAPQAAPGLDFKAVERDLTGRTQLLADSSFDKAKGGAGAGSGGLAGKGADLRERLLQPPPLEDALSALGRADRKEPAAPGVAASGPIGGALVADSAGLTLDSPRVQALRPDQPKLGLALNTAPAQQRQLPSYGKALAPEDGSLKVDAFGLVAPLAGNVTQQFTQVASRAVPDVALAKPAVALVLNSFRLEQSGENLAIIDNDGSIYSGFLRAAAAPVLADRGESKSEEAIGREPRVQAPQRVANAPVAGRARSALGQAPQATQSPVPRAQAYFFRVVGTNRSLNQRVLFSGNLLVPTNLPTAAEQEVRIAPAPEGWLRSTSNALSQSQSRISRRQIQNAQINGQAVVGGGQTLTIEATPAPQR